ncbi:hypothetical protein AFIC_002610 [[Pseudomonas] carboxydohydrogena]|uniref:Transmembrane protein n=1 Tax=Afipia carboxydohydrogena TaxID=290 RepID=A0ABY8BNT3_AFICR|nr:hypothetical protein [[Pseudomonas] carboxydohydrogena]WEF51046.1 hypothetical protein AFIC_002610 [[Pseudomonas] carboxydohydrogena]
MSTGISLEQSPGRSPGRSLGRRGRLTMWAIATAIILVFTAANWHFIYVAVTSQPDCVSHLRLGNDNAAQGSFSAAQSSCTPK